MYDSQEKLGLTFLRYQEFYECPSDEFKNSKFTLERYKEWYVETYGSFSYTKDWVGFNIPASIIKSVIELGIIDRCQEDATMASVLKIIGDDAYLVGITADGDLQRHELTHALYHVDDDYRAKCQEIIQMTSQPTLVTLENIIYDLGYAETSIWDEIQAYMTTGDMGFFDDVEDQLSVTALRERLCELHSQHYKF